MDDIKAFGKALKFHKVWKNDKNTVQLYKEFAKLENNTKRFIWSQMHFRNLMVMPSLIEQKDLTAANNLLEAGNTSFKKGYHADAIFLYTRCIALAPPDSNVLAIAYFERCKVLLNKGYPSIADALRDIELALKSNYPKNQHYNFIFRKAQCLRRLGRSAESRQLFDTARQYLATLRICNTRKAELIRKIDGEIAISHTYSKNRMPPPRPVSKLPSLSGGPNIKIPVVSKYVTVYNRPMLGRQLEATEDILPGEVLVVNPSLCTLLNPVQGNHHRYCEHCLKGCLCLLPCETCSWAMYCSPKCRKASAKTHQIQCWLQPLLMRVTSDPRNLCLTMKMILSCGLDEVLKFMTLHKRGGQFKRSSLDRFAHGNSITTRLHHFYHLPCTTHTTAEYFIISLMAVATVTLIGHLIPPESHVIFGSVLIHFLKSRKAPSVSSISVKNKPVTYDVSLSLCTTTYLMRHSCDPNAHVTFLDRHSVVRSIKSIPKGSTITFSIINGSFLDIPLEKRQEKIYKMTRAKCACQACTENLPLASDFHLLPNHVHHDRLSRSLVKPHYEQIYGSMYKKNHKTGLIKNKKKDNKTSLQKLNLQVFEGKNDTYCSFQNRDKVYSAVKHLDYLEYDGSRISEAYNIHQSILIKIYSNEANMFNKH